MAASVTSSTVATYPWHIEKLTISSVEAGATITASHSGPSGVAPVLVELGQLTTAPTSGSPVFLTWEGSSTSADTVTLRLNTEVGGDLTGLVCEVNLIFVGHASGGLTNVS